MSTMQPVVPRCAAVEMSAITQDRLALGPSQQTALLRLDTVWLLPLWLLQWLSIITIERGGEVLVSTQPHGSIAPWRNKRRGA